jgi:hypothetical protein
MGGCWGGCCGGCRRGVGCCLDLPDRCLGGLASQGSGGSHGLGPVTPRGPGCLNPAPPRPRTPTPRRPTPPPLHPSAQIIADNLRRASANEPHHQYGVASSRPLLLPGRSVKYHSPPRLPRKAVHAVRHAACKLYSQLGLQVGAGVALLLEARGAWVAWCV